MAFNLPPESKERIVTIKIPKEVDPYFKEWYLDTKKDGESPDEFTYRNLAKAGMAYRKQKVKEDRVSAARVLIDADELEHDTVILDSGLG